MSIDFSVHADAIGGPRSGKVSRIASVIFMAAAVVALGGCADRQGSIHAAEQLAEVNYPGQLEVVGTHLQKSYYEVILAMKDDPFTRIHLQIDPDPSACRVGTACEKRLRKAYVEGRARGGQLKAMNAAFRNCGVPLLATHPLNGRTAYVVELDLGLEDQQPALDRLANCTQAFADAYGEPIRHNFRIFRPRGGAPAQTPGLVTFETELPRERRDEPSYWFSVDPASEDIVQENLRIDTEIFRSGPVHDKMVKAARTLLKKERPNAVMRWPNIFWKTQLDPQRADVVRMYLMACSEDREGPCRQDLAFRMTYDLSAGALTDLSLLEAPQGVDGLPDLPGRKAAPSSQILKEGQNDV